jgi:hypothetical protein
MRAQQRTVQAVPLDLRADIGAVNNDARTVDLTFATPKADVLRYDWETGKRFYERLSLDPKHVRMERLSSGTAPLLDTHSAWSLASQIGVVQSATVNGKRGEATVRFSKRAEVEPFYQDVLDKIIRNNSVGYRVFRFEDTGEARNGYAVMLATDWEPYEISMVPMGADAGARTRSHKDIETNPCVITRSGLTDADRARNFRLAMARAS